MSTDFVIKIPNQFLRELNEEELYMYFFLRMHESKHFKNRVITNIHLIEEKVKFLASKSENRKRIIKILKNLKQKEIIKIIKAKKLNFLEIELKDEKEYIKHGYESIPYSLFEKINQKTKPNEKGLFFKLSCFIKRTKRPISFVEIADILKISDRQAKNIVRKMEEKELIIKQSGKYYLTVDGEFRQEKNNYSLDKSNENIKFDENKNNNIDNEREEMIKKWKSYGIIQVDEMVYYLKNKEKDEELKMVAERKMKKIMETERGQKAIESLINEAKTILEKQEREQKGKEESNALKMSYRTNKTIIKTKTAELKPYEGEDISDIEAIFFTIDRGENPEDYDDCLVKVFYLKYIKTPMQRQIVKEFLNKKSKLNLKDYFELEQKIEKADYSCVEA